MQTSKQVLMKYNAFFVYPRNCGVVAVFELNDALSISEAGIKLKRMCAEKYEDELGAYAPAIRSPDGIYFCLGEEMVKL